jgi:hypothetical protein
MPRPVAAVAMAAAVLGISIADGSARICKPRRSLPSLTLVTLGPCAFNPETLGFAGEPAEQARCLLRGTDRSRRLGPTLESIPPGLARRAGQAAELPDRDAVAAHLTELGLMWDYAPFLWTPISRARDNDPEAPQARYLVIHDTSAPNFGGRPFPVDIDEHFGTNNLARDQCADGWGPAHVIVNRTGAMLVTHELSQPWRATKFERATRFGTALKGLFLHVELTQPRRSNGRGRRNDALAPTPGFSEVQYDRLALIYTIASVRAGYWLIPAFHAAIDAEIRGGHDDPQNFELDAFAASLDRLTARLEQRRQALAAPHNSAMAVGR